MTAIASPPIERHEIQGNVLRGYGRHLPYATYLPVEVTDAAAGRRLLAGLRRRVQDASDWPRQTPSSALNVAISYRGLRALDVPDEGLLEHFPPEFRDGMEARARWLGDIGRGAPAHWERGLRGIHLLLVVHAADENELTVRLGALEGDVRAAGLEPAHAERSFLLPHEKEHFGYVDGFGQPAITGVKSNRHRPGIEPEIALGEFVHGYTDEDGQCPTLPDPFARNGTFMVFRKLAQDVNGFRRLLAAIANRDFHGGRDLAAAKLAGRSPDGTPLVKGKKRFTTAELNDFGYADDPDGRVCPLGAHIRRANPRDGLHGGFNRTRRHRIIRRGKTYGPPLPDDGVRRAEAPDVRGLLFVCFNASIARQFEVVNGWLNDGAPFGLGRDADVLAGLATERPSRLMSIQGGPPVLVPARSFVWARGGEYLFLPSRSALAALAEP